MIRAIRADVMISVLMAGACGVPAAAFAQSADVATAPDPADSGMTDIVVTAQKRSERLQDVPIAVTAISGEALSAKGIPSTLDIQQVTPGLTFTTSSGTAAPRIRGVGTGQAIAGNESSVATYVDGVYYASSASSVMQLSNIEQVAVLRGPQGTLFGRNATGGLIQITTLDPKHELGGKFSASYGNKKTVGASLYLTGGLSDAVAADISLYYNNQGEGFGINRFNGRDVGNSRDFAARSKWLFTVGEDTTIKLLGDYSETDGATVARRLESGSLPRIGTVFTGNPFDVNSNIQPSYASKRYGFSGELIHHFDGFDFSSITAYRHARTHVTFDGDGTQVENVSITNQFLPEEQFTQEFQLTSKGGGAFQWTAGAYYFDGNGRLSGFFPNAAMFSDVGQRVKAYAAYAQGTYKLTSATSLTVRRSLFLGNAPLRRVGKGDTRPRGHSASAGDRRPQTFQLEANMAHRARPPFE